MSCGGPAKIGCDAGVLFYVPLGIKRHKSKSSLIIKKSYPVFDKNLTL